MSDTIRDSIGWSGAVAVGGAALLGYFVTPPKCAEGVLLSPFREESKAEAKPAWTENPSLVIMAPLMVAPWEFLGWLFDKPAPLTKTGEWIKTSFKFTRVLGAAAAGVLTYKYLDGRARSITACADNKP